MPRKPPRARPPADPLALPLRLSLPVDQRPPRAVTRALFHAWRSPRDGVTNPQRLTNPVWSWLARTPQLNAYMANAHFRGPSSMTAGPCWCNRRFGQSRTALPDGRMLLIAGEHEDYYDPDFYIYNDVIVLGPSGELEVYGYPRDVLPPTDFHTATLVDDRIVILGCLGHPRQRLPGVTPGFVLDTGTLAIAPLATTGAAPGWIFRHSAELSSDRRAIVVRGGERVELVDGAPETRENIDDWSLDLDSLAWSRLTARRWPLWELRRADGTRNELMTIGWMPWHVGGRRPFDHEQLATFEAQLGWLPDFATYASRYTPAVEHAPLPERDGESTVTRISVEGVTVRYVEEGAAVRITVEGALAPSVIDAIIADARRKLEALERRPYEARLLRAG